MPAPWRPAHDRATRDPRGSTFEEQIGYARAVIHGDSVHVSGTTGFDYTTMTISDDVVEQAEQCLRDIGAVPAEAGRTFADVVRCALPAARPGRIRALPAGPAPLVSARSGRPPPCSLCGLADPRMKIEIEVYAQRPAR
ncbi:hypothetical protein GCM10023238_22840 [Streptomyces heliomycini]